MMAWIFRSAKWSAIVGGLVLCAITLMSVASITGRALIGVGLGPVPGDFEMVEVGTACLGATSKAGMPRWTCSTCTCPSR